MNLKWIHNKIKHTRLFSDAQKVELMALLPDASAEDIRKLGDGIDAFDTRYTHSTARHGKKIQQILADLMHDVPKEDRASYQEAIDEIAMGTELLKSSSV